MWSRCAKQEVQSLISSIIFGPTELPSNALQWLNRNGLGFPKKSLFCFFRLFFYRSDMSIAHWASCSKIYNFGNGRLFLFICNFQCLRLCLCLWMCACLLLCLCLLVGHAMSPQPSDQLSDILSKIEFTIKIGISFDLELNKFEDGFWDQMRFWETLISKYISLELGCKHQV